MRRRLTSLLIVMPSALTGCVGAPAPVAPPPRAVPVPVRPPPVVALSADWRDWPVTPGTWTYRGDGRGSVAMFGRVGDAAALVVRCDLGARALYLSIAGAGAAAMTIRTSTAVRTLALRPAGGVPAYLAAALPPGDGLIDAIGYSRGRFVVTAPPLARLVVPAWPEVLRVAEDCRN